MHVKVPASFPRDGRRSIVKRCGCSSFTERSMQRLPRVRSSTCTDYLCCGKACAKGIPWFLQAMYRRVLPWRDRAASVRSMHGE